MLIESKNYATCFHETNKINEHKFNKFMILSASDLTLEHQASIFSAQHLGVTTGVNVRSATGRVCQACRVLHAQRSWA
jgi:hypothetical protein